MKDIFEVLPPNVFHQLALHLSYSEIVALCEASAHANTILSNAPWIWNDLIERDFWVEGKSDNGTEAKQAYERLHVLLPACVFEIIGMIKDESRYKLIVQTWPNEAKIGLQAWFTLTDPEKKTKQGLALYHVLEILNAMKNGSIFQPATPLVKWLQWGKFAVAEALTTYTDIDVNTIDIDGQHAALWKVDRSERPGYVTLLLQHPKFDPNRKAKNGRTILHALVTNANTLDFVNALLSIPATDVNAVDNDGNTPLILAINRDVKCDNEIMMALISHTKIDISIRNKAGRNALIECMRNLYVEVKTRDILINKTTDLDLTDNNGDSALSIACITYSLSRVQSLIQHKASLNDDNLCEKILILAARQGNDDVLDLLHSKGFSFHVKDDSKTTPLIAAAENGHFTTVKKLIHHKVDVNQKNQMGQTAISRVFNLYAQSEQYEKVVLELINSGATIPQKFGDILALCDALRHDWYLVAEKILQQGIDINAVTEEGWSSLHMAAGTWVPVAKRTYDYSLKIPPKINKEQVEWLIDKGANIALRDKEGNTPLHIAATYKHVSVCSVLIKQGALLNMKNNANMTPLSIALTSKTNYDPDTIITLIQAGARIEPKIYGIPVLFYVACCDRARYSRNCLNELLKHGIDIHQATDTPDLNMYGVIIKKGETPLSCAFRLEEYDIALGLLEAGADISKSFGEEKQRIQTLRVQELTSFIRILSTYPSILFKLEFGPSIISPEALRERGGIQILEIILTNTHRSDGFQQWINACFMHLVTAGKPSEVTDKMLLLLLEAGAVLKQVPFDDLVKFLHRIPFTFPHRHAIKKLSLEGVWSIKHTLDDMVAIGIKFSHDEMMSIISMRARLTPTQLFNLCDVEMCSKSGVAALGMYFLKMIDQNSSRHAALKEALDAENLPACYRLMTNAHQGCLQLSWFARRDPLWEQVPQEFKQYMRDEIRAEQQDGRVPGTTLIRMPGRTYR